MRHGSHDGARLSELIWSGGLIENSNALRSKDGQPVDDFEDARFPEFNKVQQLSTSCLHLIETEAAEMGIPAKLNALSEGKPNGIPG